MRKKRTKSSYLAYVENYKKEEAKGQKMARMYTEREFNAVKDLHISAKKKAAAEVGKTWNPTNAARDIAKSQKIVKRNRGRSSKKRESEEIIKNIHEGNYYYYERDLDPRSSEEKRRQKELGEKITIKEEQLPGEFNFKELRDKKQERLSYGMGTILGVEHIQNANGDIVLDVDGVREREAWEQYEIIVNNLFGIVY